MQAHKMQITEEDKVIFGRIWFVAEMREIKALFCRVRILGLQNSLKLLQIIVSGDK